MTINDLAQRARSAAVRIGRWALRRARERSTWIGLGAAATALGYSRLGSHLSSLGDVVPALLVAGGLSLASATTTPHPVAPDQPAN